MKTLHLFALAALLTAAAYAPVSAQSREQRQMMADLRILQVQAQEMQNMVSALNQALSDALKALNARLNDQNEATRRSFAEQKSIIDTLSNDLRIVREKLDDNNVRVGSLAQEVDSLRGLITAMPRGGDGPIDPAAAAPAAAGGAPPAGGLGTSPQRAYDAAMSDYWAATTTWRSAGSRRISRASHNPIAPPTPSSTSGSRTTTRESTRRPLTRTA